MSVTAKALAEKERAEAAAAAETARTERAEAAKAMEKAKQERAQASTAQALAAHAERDAEKQELEATRAERKAEATVWKQERVRLMMPLVNKDQVYNLIVKPAYRAMNRDKKKGKITKQEKKRLDRQFTCIHFQAEHLFEDFEFLQECFNIMRETEEIDSMDDTGESARYMVRRATITSQLLPRASAPALARLL
eukprot:COSAG05_NODE_3616_length_1958_cov_1.297472_2_plen_194_part_00